MGKLKTNFCLLKQCKLVYWKNQTNLFFYSKTPLSIFNTFSNKKLADIVSANISLDSTELVYFRESYNQA